MWISKRSSEGPRSELVLVLCGRQGWGRSLVSVAWLVQRPSIGTLVNSDSTSKDTMISLSRIVSLLIEDTKWAEFLTVKSELPVKGRQDVS